MKRLGLLLITVIGLGGTAAPTVAAPVTFNFAGTVTQATIDADGQFPGNPTLGTPFSGSYKFDSTSIDAIAAPGSGSYTSPSGLPFGMNVLIGGVGSGATAFLNIGVVDGASSDFYTVLLCGNAGCGTFSMELLFQDFDHTVFASDALPLDAPPFAAFELAAFTFRTVFQGLEVEILGQVTSLTCVEGCAVTEPTPDPALVPEPSTVVLCTTGLIATVIRRRRRSSIQGPQEQS